MLNHSLKFHKFTFLFSTLFTPEIQMEGVFLCSWEFMSSLSLYDNILTSSWLKYPISHCISNIYKLKSDKGILYFNPL